MATGGRMYGGSDAAKTAIVDLEARLHAALDGHGDAGLQLCAVVNLLLDHLDVAPVVVQEFYIEQILLVIGHNYGTVHAEATLPLPVPTRPGKPS